MTEENSTPKADQKGGNKLRLVQISAPRSSRPYTTALTTPVHPQISLDELARNMVVYLKQKGIVIVKGGTQLTNRTGPNNNSSEIAGVPNSPSHGRYFSRIGLDHYVYLDEKQESIGLALLSDKSGLFGPLAAWSVSHRMAIFRVENEDSLEKVRETLTGNGFEQIESSRDALETGFKTGDTSPIINGRKN